MAVMCARGDLKKPDAMIFSDTQCETKATYEYLEWFEKWMVENGLPKLVKVTNGNLMEHALDESRRFATMPLFTEPSGMLMRQCTNDYKIQPVMRGIRKLLGLKKGERCKTQINLWLGISVDEAVRMKDSRIKWITNVYHLIDKNMTRADCMAYLKKNNIEIPPKSACIVCPFHSNSFWRYLKKTSPVEFEQACQFDDAIRNRRVAIKNKVYLHRGMKPLRETYLEEDQMDLFGNECDGHCGL